MTADNFSSVPGGPKWTKFALAVPNSRLFVLFINDRAYKLYNPTLTIDIGSIDIDRVLEMIVVDVKGIKVIDAEQGAEVVALLADGRQVFGVCDRSLTSGARGGRGGRGGGLLRRRRLAPDKQVDAVVDVVTSVGEEIPAHPRRMITALPDMTFTSNV